MLKAGFLGVLGSTITLKSVPEVVAETGWPTLPVTVVSTEGDAGPGLKSNDHRLLEFAGEAGLPVISEDREILRGAEAQGLDYYNSLMMLAFLRYRERLDRQWYEEAKERLLKIAHYGKDVIERFAVIETELGVDG